MENLFGNSFLNYGIFNLNKYPEVGAFCMLKPKTNTEKQSYKTLKAFNLLSDM